MPTALDRRPEPTGVDLDHHVSVREDGIAVHAIVTPTQSATLETMGFDMGTVVHSVEDTESVLEEREATIAANMAENGEFAALAYDQTNPDVSDVKIIRADYYTSFGQGVLSVEAKWANGQNATNALTVQLDSGPGTEMGSGGQQNISRFVDVGVYLYHRGASNVSTRPDYIRITSPTGDVAVAKVNDWLPLDTDEPDPLPANPNAGSAYRETMEFSNGLVELMRVAYDFDKDKQRPESTLVTSTSLSAGMVNVQFETSEPAAVFYTLDGSTPTYDSTLYGAGGIRESGELLTVAEGTKIHWFSVDSAGNVERNDRPDGNAKNYNKGVATVTP